MSDLTREQIELHIAKLIPQTLGIAKSSEGFVDEEERIKTLKSMLALASFDDPDFIFKCLEYNLIGFKNKAEDILDTISKLLSPDALLGIKTNSISGITDFSSIQNSVIDISNNINNSGKYGGKSSSENLEDFLETQIKPQLSNLRKETVVPLLKKLFKSSYESYSSFQTDISSIFNSVENYDSDEIKKILSETVLARIQQELIYLLLELTQNISEEEQGTYIEETGLIVTTIKNVLDKIVTDPVNPIGSKVAGVFDTGSTGQKASFLTGQLKSEPAKFLYKAPFKPFIDYRMAENNGSTLASTTKSAKYPLTPPSGSNFNLSAVSSSDFLEISIDSSLLKVSMSDLAVGPVPTSLQLATAIRNSTTLIGALTTDGNTTFLSTVSANSNQSVISILSTSSQSFTDALGVTVDKKYKGKQTVRVLQTGSVNPTTFLSTAKEYYIRIVGQGSYKVDSFNTNSITVKGELEENLSNVSYIVTEKILGTLVYPSSTLTTPVSEDYPQGRTLPSLWRAETSGNYEVPYIDSGSSGSLLREVALFGRMSNYLYQSETGVGNPIKYTRTTGKSRDPIYTASTGKVGLRVSSSLGGVSIVGGTIGKPTPTVSNPVLLYLPSSNSSDSYILNYAPFIPSDSNYRDNDFVSEVGRFLKLGDYIEVSDSGSVSNPQDTANSNFEEATFRVKYYSAGYKPHTISFPAVGVLPDYDFEDSGSFSNYEHWDDTGFINSNFFQFTGASDFSTARYPHGELSLDIIQIHKFRISSGNFEDITVKNGDYMMVHPVSGSNTVDTWMNAVGEKANSKFYEIFSKSGSRELTLNTGWVNTYSDNLNNSKYSYSSPFYDKDDKFYGLFRANTLNTSTAWQSRGLSTGHNFFIFKKGTSEYDADGTTIFINDSFYSFSDSSAEFIQNGVTAGDLLCITNVGNSNPYSLSYSSNYLSASSTSLTFISVSNPHTIGLVESENQLYAYGSSSALTDGYGKKGFDYTASNITYEIRDPRYRKIIKDANATFISDGVQSGMYVHVYERDGSSVNYTLTIDEVLSETQLLFTSNVHSSDASEMNIKYYVSTNDESIQKGNICSIVKLNIHDDYDYDIFSAGIEKDSYTIYYLDKDGASNSQVASLNIFEIKSSGKIQIAATASTSVSNSYLPIFYNTPFCIIKNESTTSLFKQSTDLTTYTGFPSSSEIESEDREMHLRILGGRQSDIAGIGGLNQFSDDNTIIRLSDQLSTNVTVSDITDTPGSDEDSGKPIFSGSDTSLVFGLAAGTTIKRFYGTFVSTDTNAEVIWNYGDSNETRHTVSSVGTGYVTLSEDVETITDPDESFTNISGRETKSVGYYSIIPTSYPNAGDEIVYGSFRAQIKSVLEARTRLYSSRSDVSETKVCYELSTSYPLNEDISGDAYLVEKGEDPRILKIFASSILDQDGLTSSRGFLSTDLVGATLTVYGNSPFTVTIKKASGKYALELEEEIIPIIEDTNFAIDLGFFDTIDNLKSGQLTSAISSVVSGNKVSVWGDNQVYEVSESVSGTSIKLSPNIVADRQDLTFVVWKNGSSYYGHYLILKNLINALSFDQNLDILSRYLNEVIASYGADLENIYTYGSLLGTSSIAEATDEYVIKAGGFSNVAIGDKVTAVIYENGSHRTVETYVKSKDSNDQITLYELLVNTIVYLKIDRNAVSYSIGILQDISSNLTSFVDAIANFPSVTSTSADASFDLLKEEGFDNAFNILRTEGISELLKTSYEEFSNEGSLNKSIQDLGSSLYSE